MNETTTIEQHIKNWMIARTHLRNAQATLNTAECNVANAVIGLGKALLPTDAKIDEEFQVLVEGRLLYVKKVRDSGNGDYMIYWRDERPKKTTPVHKIDHRLVVGVETEK